MLEKAPKVPPHYRKVPNTNYIVDCFGIESSNYIFFLSHFHADHYGGLNKKFSSIIYCSKTTSNLAKKLTKKECLYSLELYMWYKIEPNNYVILCDANHCPGAVCFIFCISGSFYFHSGDFRCASEFYSQFESLKISNDIIELPLHANNTNISNLALRKPKLEGELPKMNLLQIDYENLYIDNTYEGFKPFDTQTNIIHEILNSLEKKIYDCNVLVPIKYCFMFATYSVGKEKIFLSVAEHFGFDIYASKYKMDLVSCIDDKIREKIDKEVKTILQAYRRTKNSKKLSARYLVERKNWKKRLVEETETEYMQKNYKSLDCEYENVFDRFTTKASENSIHIISMMHLNKVKLENIVKGFNYDKIVIIAGTGWKNTTRFYDWVKGDGRKVKNGIEVIYMPYSEHSSSDELVHFKNLIKCKNIINTVKNKW